MAIRWLSPGTHKTLSKVPSFMEHAPWEHKYVDEGEPNRWYHRFVLFRDMGPTRTLLGCVHIEEAQKRAEKRSKSVSGSWLEASKKWDWKTRAEAWDAHLLAEQEARQAHLCELEEQEKERALTSGYAAMHRRVEALDKLANKLEAYMEEEQNIWLPDVKAVGTGEFAERVDLVRFNDALISEYRATFADLAAELGHRVKKTKQEITGKDGKPIQTQQVEIYQVRLPDNGRSE